MVGARAWRRDAAAPAVLGAAGCGCWARVPRWRAAAPHTRQSAHRARGGGCAPMAPMADPGTPRYARAGACSAVQCSRAASAHSAGGSCALVPCSGRPPAAAQLAPGCMGMDDLVCSGSIGGRGHGSTGLYKHCTYYDRDAVQGVHPRGVMVFVRSW